MRPPLVSELHARYLLGDGAMGTELLKQGLPVGGCPELWNAEAPDKVLAVHQAYVDAGADCITTNTFGANRFRLEERGESAGRVVELNRTGVEIARKAAGETRWVLGSMGPCAGKNTEVGSIADSELQAAYAEQVAALAEAGADALLLETQTDLAEVRSAIAAWKATAATVPMFVTFAFARSPQGLQLPRSGETLEQVINAVLPLQPSGVGANCGADVDIFEYSTILAAFRARTDLPILAQPNAGPVVACGGTYECAHSPEVMVEGVWGLIRAGANLVGGCCGTTPTHLHLFREELNRL